MTSVVWSRISKERSMSHRSALALSIALTLVLATGIFAGRDRLFEVAAGAGRIRQVARILLDNAISYTPRGGAIRVVAERRGSRAVVAVSDTGTGIPPAEQAHVFDR